MRSAALLLIYQILSYGIAYGQTQTPDTQTPCTTASEGKAGNFVISYTIGEMPLVTTEKNNGLIITQGLMQPITSIAKTTYSCFKQTEVKVFPNPTTGMFSLQLSILTTGKFSSLLIDAAGKTIQQESFVYNGFTTKSYNIQTLASGQYYLQLIFVETGTDKEQKCVYTIQKTI
jgi:hypothetical protein